MRLCTFALALLASTAAAQQAIPSTEARTLDGHTLTLPRDLTGPTILLIGFSRKSADQTTAWQKQLHTATTLHVYDVAMLAAVPPLARPLVRSAIRHQVPDQFEPDFLLVTDHEPDWKLATRYDPKAPDAAYVLLLTPAGQILWQTHAPCTPAALHQLLTHTN